MSYHRGIALPLARPLIPAVPQRVAAWLWVALSVMVGCAGTRVHLADTEYSEERIMDGVGATGHIVKDPLGIFFVSRSEYRLYLLRTGVGSPSAIDGLPDLDVYDILALPTGELWVATHRGLYRYNRITRIATNTGITNKCIINLAMTAKGQLSVVDAAANMYTVRGEALGPLDMAPVHCVAYSRAGDRYHTDAWVSAVFRRRVGIGGRTAQLRGLPFGVVSFLEVDWRDNTLYVCHTEGLFLYRETSGTAQQVEGIAGEVMGMGFTLAGDAYIGKESSIVKMSFMFSVHRNNKTIVSNNVRHRR